MTNRNMVKSPQDAQKAGQTPNIDSKPPMPAPEGSGSAMTTQEPTDSPGLRPDLAPTHVAGLGTKKPGE